MTLEAKKPRTKTCKICKAEFAPRNSLQKACSVPCAMEVVKADNSKKKRAVERKERAERLDARRRLKTKSEWLKEAECAVRDYRRLYELSIGSGCISCGRTQEEILAEQGWKTGGAFDGGHFLGKGARPELRLIPSNIWLQCKGCNAGSSKYPRKTATVAHGFREGLIERIGLEAVEALECDHEPRRYTIEQLKAIKEEYRAKVRELKSKQ